MATDRTTRDQTQHVQKHKEKAMGNHPAKLDAPPPPAGFEHRWIRTTIRGEDDKSNVFSRMREGWEPVRADEYPSCKVSSD